MRKKFPVKDIGFNKQWLHRETGGDIPSKHRHLNNLALGCQEKYPLPAKIDQKYMIWSCFDGVCPAYLIS